MQTAVTSQHPAASAFSSMAAALHGADQQTERDASLRQEETQARLRYVHWFEARWMAEAFIVERLSVEEIEAKFSRPRYTIWEHIKRVTHMVPRDARVHYSLHGWDFPEPEQTTRKPGRKPKREASQETPMNKDRRRRLAGQYAAMAAPPDRSRTVQHYQDLARQAELHRLEAERERIIGALVTAQQRIDELRRKA